MLRKKIVFLGSKPIGYDCFAYLISQKDILNIEIAGLLTNTRKEFGDAHDLNTLGNEHDIPVFEDMDEIPECDIIYSVQYHWILKADDIKKAKQAAVNLHMAPLPEYRGSNQFSYAIIDGKKEFGTTIHQIDTRIDHGDILFQKRFPIPDNCWVNQLYELTYDASLDLFKESLQNIIDGNYKPIIQQSLLSKYSTSLHFRKEIVKLKEIDLGWGKDKIERYIRATSMPGFEPPYFLLDGKKIYFSQSHS
ncbi:MAG TPA: formyltransferase family protein [Flavipsychrobacter sp.]|nr:formyltransferase family protein [Flavipsychrobacter sp.]